jgi:hypothetical protein
MISTCSALVAVHFGLLVALALPSWSFKVVPEFFFAVSMIFFAASYFAREKTFGPDAPDEIRAAHYDWLKAKATWHKWGFALFFCGLLAMAITTLIGGQSVNLFEVLGIKDQISVEPFIK